MKSQEQKIREHNELLLKHLQKADFIKISRTFKEEINSLNGIILQISDDFLLIKKIDDFLVDGFVIIRQDQFENIECGANGRTYKKILLRENIITKNISPEFTIDISDWRTIFQNLKKLDFHVVIECEELEDPTFTIGPIKRLTEKNVSIQYYNPKGELENKNTIVNFDDITTLSFGDRYSSIFRKYLK